MEDKIVQKVINKYRERSDVGIRKYGVTMDREDFDLRQWLIEAQQEAMDFVLYLESAIKKLDE